MIEYSFILPTRGHQEDLIKTVDSFILKAENKHCFEFVVVVDTDDPQKEEIKKRLNWKQVRVLEVLPSDWFCKDYYNLAVWSSCGKSVCVMTDDVICNTDCWDAIIRNKVGDTEIYLVDVWDTTHEHEGVSFPRFPIISRKAINTIGFFLYPQIKLWPADGIIYILYKSVNSIIKCHEVEFIHNHIDNTDPSKSRFLRLFNEDKKNGIFPVNVAREKWLLERAIKGNR
jgi:hypothetical protein